jgi:hypothetical protein
MPSENARLAMMRAVRKLEQLKHHRFRGFGLSAEQMAEILERESGFGEVCEALEIEEECGGALLRYSVEAESAILRKYAHLLPDGAGNVRSLVFHVACAALAKARGDAPTEAAGEK